MRWTGISPLCLSECLCLGRVQYFFLSFSVYNQNIYHAIYFVKTWWRGCHSSAFRAYNNRIITSFQVLHLSKQIVLVCLAAIPIKLQSWLRKRWHKMICNVIFPTPQCNWRESASHNWKPLVRPNLDIPFSTNCLHLLSEFAFQICGAYIDSRQLNQQLWKISWLRGLCKISLYSEARVK
jgi:hypothetical protein